MTEFTKLLTFIKSYLVGAKYYTALKALDFAREHHIGTRKDGKTPEFEHQVKMCLHIMTLKDLANQEMAITITLLHDIVEDYVSVEELAKKFGKEVSDKVWLLTKKYKKVNKEYKVYFDELASDPITSVVKGVDRINNIQTMEGVFSMEKQLSYVDEVDKYFLPMLKKARGNFPEQSAAYFNIQQMLIRECEWVKRVNIERKRLADK